jgi:hypothetical protein
VPPDAAASEAATLGGRLLHDTRGAVGAIRGRELAQIVNTVEQATTCIIEQAN